MGSNSKVILHIGDSKTGTSALQWFLLHNRNILARQGYEYPKHEIDPNDISSGNALQLALSLRENDFSQAKKIAHSLLSHEKENTILSSEYLFALKEDKIEELANYFYVFKIVVYVRSQDSSVLSKYNQAVKRNYQKIPFEHCLTKLLNNPIQFKRFAYLSMLSNWSNIFGKEKIIVRPYENIQFHGGTIFSDFLSIFNMPLTSEYILPETLINRSYTNDALEFKRLANHLELKNNPLDRYLQAYSDIHKDCTTLISPEMQKKVSISFAAYNEIIAREYLKRDNGILFYDDTRIHCGPAIYAGLQEEKICDICSFITRESCETAALLAEAISGGLKSDDETVRNAASKLSFGLEFLPQNGRVIALCGEYIRHPKKLITKAAQLCRRIFKKSFKIITRKRLC